MTTFGSASRFRSTTMRTLCCRPEWSFTSETSVMLPAFTALAAPSTMFLRTTPYGISSTITACRPLPISSTCITARRVILPRPVV